MPTSVSSSVRHLAEVAVTCGTTELVGARSVGLVSVGFVSFGLVAGAALVGAALVGAALVGAVLGLAELTGLAGFLGGTASGSQPLVPTRMVSFSVKL